MKDIRNNKRNKGDNSNMNNKDCNSNMNNKGTLWYG